MNRSRWKKLIKDRCEWVNDSSGTKQRAVKQLLLVVLWERETLEQSIRYMSMSKFIRIKILKLLTHLLSVTIICH